MTNRIIHVFFDTDMRCGHIGLAEKAKKEGNIEVNDLETGHLLCFINAKQDRIMILTGTDEEKSYGVLAYYRSPRGRIDLDSIRFIPEAFNAGGINYDRALKKSLIERLGKRSAKNEDT